MTGTENSTVEAFQRICKQAREARGYYVSLMIAVPYYGGPEEGGWWGEDHDLVQYQRFSTEGEAVAARDAIIALSKTLNRKAKRDADGQCLAEWSWCEDRDLEADYLPEPAGPDRYFALMTEGIPEEKRGPRHYE